MSLRDPFMPTGAVLLLVALAALGAPSAAVEASGATAASGATGATEAPARLVDRVVAVVDEDPILDSDIERLVGLGVVTALPGETRAAERRRALDLAIEQKLRLHEVDRFGFAETPLEELDRKVEEIRSRFASEGEFRAELDRLGLDETSLRQLVARQLSVLAYVEERLGPRVFVSVDDIGRYYQEELLPELRRQGAGTSEIPTLESVRESIRAVLRERRLNEEIDRWTADLRAKADVVDYLERDDRPLPPLVATWGSEAP